MGATTVYRILKNERRKGRIFPKVKRRLDPEKEERRIGRMREAFYNPKDPRKQAERISRFVEYSHTEECIEKIAVKLRGRRMTLAQRERQSEARTGVIRTHPRVAKGPQHWRSMQGILKSPTNVLYPFSNLTHFVREHVELFYFEDCPTLKRRLQRAFGGLEKLFLSGKNYRTSWYGWTVACPDIDPKGFEAMKIAA